MTLKNTLIKHAMQALLRLSAALARRESLKRLSSALMTLLAKIAIASKGIRRVDSLPELGRQWQRGFPSAKQVPITAITEDTVYAEIHTPCPLRDSGDVHACHRMMQFDREVLRKAGGQFVVLASQATPGNRVCRVAIRRAGAPVDDLPQAHLIRCTPARE